MGKNIGKLRFLTGAALTGKSRSHTVAALTGKSRFLTGAALIGLAVAGCKYESLIGLHYHAGGEELRSLTVAALPKLAGAITTRPGEESRSLTVAALPKLAGADQNGAAATRDWTGIACGAGIGLVGVALMVRAARKKIS